MNCGRVVPFGGISVRTAQFPKQWFGTFCG